MNVETIKALTPIILAITGSFTSVSVVALAVLAPRVTDNKFNSLTYVATALGSGGLAGAAGASQSQKGDKIDRIDNVEEMK